MHPAAAVLLCALCRVRAYHAYFSLVVACSRTVQSAKMMHFDSLSTWYFAAEETCPQVGATSPSHPRPPEGVKHRYYRLQPRAILLYNATNFRHRYFETFTIRAVDIIHISSINNRCARVSLIRYRCLLPCFSFTCIALVLYLTEYIRAVQRYYPCTQEYTHTLPPSSFQRLPPSSR